MQLFKLYIFLFHIIKWVIYLYNVLTKRERQIFNYLIDNYSTAQIASLLHISKKTVRNHISNVILKLDVKGRTQAVVKLLQMNEISLKK